MHHSVQSECNGILLFTTIWRRPHRRKRRQPTRSEPKNRMGLFPWRHHESEVAIVDVNNVQSSPSMNCPRWRLRESLGIPTRSLCTRYVRLAAHYKTIDGTNFPPADSLARNVMPFYWKSRQEYYVNNYFAEGWHDASPAIVPSCFTRFSFSFDSKE